MEEINEESLRVNHPDDVSIILKDHQLAIIKRCNEIEDINICKTFFDSYI